MTLHLIALLQILSAHAASDNSCDNALSAPRPTVVQPVKTVDHKKLPARTLADMDLEIRNLTLDLKQADDSRAAVLARIAAIDEQILFSQITIGTENPGGGFRRIKRFFLNTMAQAELKTERQDLEREKDRYDTWRTQLQSRLRGLRVEKYAFERNNPQPVTAADFRHAPTLSEWPEAPRTSVPTTGPRPQASAGPQRPPYNYQEEEEKKRVATRSRILEFTQNYPYAAEELNDLLTLKKLDHVLLGKSVVFLLLGDQWSESIRQTLLDAIQKGYNVVYDADAPHGEKIREIIGAKAVGISASTEDFSQGILRIANPYRRMTFFDFGRKNAIVSPENPVAIGALLMNYTATTMFRYSGGDHEDIVSGLSKWQDYLDATSRSSKVFGGGGSWFWQEPAHTEPEEKIKNQQLGVEGFRFHNRPKITSGSVSLQGSARTAPDLDVTFSATAELDRMQHYAMKQLEDDIAGYSNAMLMASDESLPRGVVLYGSSGGSPLYENMVRQVSRAAAGVFGLMVSGGAGGFMRTANLAATEMDAVSIGVPMSGRASLRTERKVFREVQSLTISTNGYESRIPVLGKDRAVALLAPGGKGTLREIATWLVQEASKEEPGLMIFISSSYYGPLVRWLKGLPLPERIKSRISVVDNEEQFFAEVMTHNLATEADVLRIKDKIHTLNNRPESDPAPIPNPTPSPEPLNATAAPDSMPSSDPGFGIRVTTDHLALAPPTIQVPGSEPSPGVIGIRSSPAPTIQPPPPPGMPVRRVFGLLKDERNKGN